MRGGVADTTREMGSPMEHRPQCPHRGPVADHTLREAQHAPTCGGSDGREVDLVIEYGGRVHAVEVTATATPVPAHAANLATFSGLAGPGTRTALACRIDTAAALRPGVRAVPWHLAW